jgi:hypothetical protein
MDVQTFNVYDLEINAAWFKVIGLRQWSSTWGKRTPPGVREDILRGIRKYLTR